MLQLSTWARRDRDRAAHTDTDRERDRDRDREETQLWRNKTNRQERNTSGSNLGWRRKERSEILGESRE